MNTELIRRALVNVQGALSGSDEYFHKLIDEALAELSAPPDPDEHLPDDQYLAKKQERFALNPQSDEDPAPVLVAFSEAERLTAMDEYEYSLEQNTSYPVQQRLDMTAAFGAGIRHANTRAVSVDQLVEAATEVLDGMDNSISFIYVDDLREAFTKLLTVSNS